MAVAVLFFLAACAAAAIIGTPPRSLRGDAAAQTFLSTWRQSRLATFVVDSDFTRTLPDDNKLQQRLRTVQRPPSDRLIIGLGAIAGRLAGKILRCASTPEGTSRCFTSEAAPDYTSEVDGEVAGLEQYVRGDRPLYRVIDFANSADHCFRLDLALALPSPPYGEHAVFCFDRANFAPTLTVIERQEATDRTQATAVRTTVTAEDLQVLPDPGAMVGVPGPTTSSSTTTSSTTTSSTVPAAN
ncbi:MAG: hypothetical protein QOH79_2879 [Acidimicrobiaceae bacterium]